MYKRKIARIESCGKVFSCSTYVGKVICRFILSLCPQHTSSVYENGRELVYLVESVNIDTRLVLSLSSLPLLAHRFRAPPPGFVLGALALASSLVLACSINEVLASLRHSISCGSYMLRMCLILHLVLKGICIFCGFFIINNVIPTLLTKRNRVDTKPPDITVAETTFRIFTLLNSYGSLLSDVTLPFK